MQKSLAERLEIKAELARREYWHFVHWCFGPRYQKNWHNRVICRRIQRWTKKFGDHLMIFQPPQTGKSLHCEIYLPPWIFANDPYAHIIGTNYSHDLVGNWAQKQQDILQSEAFHYLFPHIRLGRTRSKDEYSVDCWIDGHWVETGLYRCAGIGGSITGYPAQYLIIGDPHKDRVNAESSAMQRHAYEWYTSVARTRLHEGSRVVLPMTRWCQGDLAGRLLKRMEEDDLADKWDVLRLPAMYETEDADPRDMRSKEGDPLWPDRFSIDHLLATKATLTTYEWEGMYQQNPSPRGEKLINREWFVPIGRNELPSGITWIRAWDLAVTEKKRASKTAGALIGRDAGTGIVYLRNLKSFRKIWPVALKTITSTAQEDGEDVRVVVEANGPQKGLVMTLAGDIEMMGFQVEPVTDLLGDKMSKALPWIAKAEAGMFKLVRGEWNEDFLDKAERFTGIEKEDTDEIDAISLGFHVIKRLGPKCFVV